MVADSMWNIVNSVNYSHKFVLKRQKPDNNDLKLGACEGNNLNYPNRVRMALKIGDFEDKCNPNDWN